MTRAERVAVGLVAVGAPLLFFASATWLRLAAGLLLVASVFAGTVALASPDRLERQLRDDDEPRPGPEPPP